MIVKLKLPYISYLQLNTPTYANPLLEVSADNFIHVIFLRKKQVLSNITILWREKMTISPHFDNRFCPVKVTPFP